MNVCSTSVSFLTSTQDKHWLTQLHTKLNCNLMYLYVCGVCGCCQWVMGLVI